MPPADSAARAGDMPEASGDSSSGTLGNKMNIFLKSASLFFLMIMPLSAKELPAAKNLDEVFLLLKSAKKLTIHGQWIPWKTAKSENPYNHSRDFISDAIVITKQADIDRITSLFKEAKFTFDPGLTKDFSQGVTIATLLHVSIDIDQAANIFVLGTDMIICDSHRTYVAKKYENDKETYFTEQLGWLLETIYKK